MIGEWMLYCALCSLGLFAASAILERWLLRGSAQVRHVWSIAFLLSMAIPAASYWLAPRKTISIPSAVSTTAQSLADSSSAAPTQPAVAAPIATPATFNQSLRKLIPTNSLAITVWIGLSSAIALYVLSGLVVLARMRRTWQPSDVCGVRVLVSERTGPAVVSVLSPQIVMPQWALSMNRYQLGLMIRHEQEHRRAGDPQLLAFAQLVLIAMPWNVALWWGVMRLRLAVELDCDSRVLRTADPRTYGELLLEVARPRRHPRLVPVAAFAERAGGLERRIRAIASRRDRVTRGARAGAVAVGLAVVAIGWTAPRPSLPPRIAIVPPGIQATPAADSKNTKSHDVARVSPETLQTRTAERTFFGDTIILPTMKSRADDVVVKTPRPAFSPLDSLIYDRLFSGVVMSADQEIAARLLLNSLANIQAQQDKAMLAANVQSATSRIQLNRERDSLLFALLSTDAERDSLAARMSRMQFGGGRRGRSGNGDLVFEVPVDALGGGPRSGGRGRVSGGDAAQGAPASNVVDGVLFSLLFNGFNLSPDQETTARSVIATYRQKTAATIPQPMPFQLRLQGTAGVLMRPESRLAILAILSNDADRAVVDSRIVTEVRVINRAPLAPPSR